MSTGCRPGAEKLTSSVSISMVNYPSARRLGDRYGLTVRPVRVSVGRWRRGLNLLIASDDPGTIGRTRSCIRVFKGLDSAAFLSGCSCRCYVAGTSRRVIAKPEEVGTGSRLSVITECIIRHYPVATASTAGGVVGL